MDPEWQIIIGIGIGSIIIELFLLLKFWKNSTSPHESQWAAMISIILGITFLCSILGLIIGLISYKKKNNKGFSKIAIGVNLVSLFLLILLIIIKGVII